jgi:hypothetical protein
MADGADIAAIESELYAKIATQKIDAIREKANSMPIGYAGDCDFCGEHSSRLVRGSCAPCRDKYRLK